MRMKRRKVFFSSFVVLVFFVTFFLLFSRPLYLYLFFSFTPQIEIRSKHREKERRSGNRTRNKEGSKRERDKTRLQEKSLSLLFRRFSPPPFLFQSFLFLVEKVLFKRRQSKERRAQVEIEDGRKRLFGGKQRG